MRRIALAFMISFVFYDISIAQWQYAGLDSIKIVYCLDAVGKYIFAGTGNQDRGLLVSSDDGASWTEANTGIPYNTYKRGITCLATNGTLMFAGTSCNGVYLSIDTGNTWTAVNNGFPACSDTTVVSLAINGNCIYAGTAGYGLYKSENSGSTWSVDTAGLTNPTIRTLATSGTHIYAGTNFGGVFRSSYPGAGWIAKNGGLTNYGKNIYALGTTGDIVIAGTQDGMFRTTDFGESWTKDTLGLGTVEAFGFVSSGPFVFAACNDGVFFTADSGLSWIDAGLTGIVITSLTVSNNSIFAGTYYNGVWKRPVSDFTGYDDKYDHASWRICPNPAGDYIDVLSYPHAHVAIVSIHNMRGQLVLRQEIYHENTRIDVSDFESGLFIVSIQTDKNISSRKFIKE